MDFWNSAEVGFKKKIYLYLCRIHRIPLNSRKEVHGIPEKILALHD
jgi:hypothetical protein